MVTPKVRPAGLATAPSPGGEVSAENANFARRWWILTVLGVAWLMVILDSSVVNIALPSAQRSLHFSDADRQWVVTAYTLAFGSLLLLGGRIGDLIGRKRAMLIGLAGFAVASALGGASVNFTMLVTARAFQGCFAALLTPALLALLTTTFTDPAERGKAFAIYGAIGGGGGGIGLLLGGVLTSYTSWRWTLFINLVFAAFAIVGAMVWLRHDKGPDRVRLDIRGVVLVTVSLFLIVVGLSHAQTTSWTDRLTLGYLVGGVLLLAVFAADQTRSKFPLLPPRVVLSRIRAGAILAMLFTNIGGFGLYLYLAYYLQETLRYSAVTTGLAFLPLVAAMVLTSQIANRVLLPRLGPKLIIPIGMLMAAAALFCLHLVGAQSSYATGVLPYVILAGLGFGLSLSPSFATGTLGLRPQEAGVGSATIQTSQQVGGSIGTALLNALAGSAAAAFITGRTATASNLRLAALHGYTTTFLWSSVIVAAGAIVIALMIPRGNMKTLAAASQPKPVTAAPSLADSRR